MIITITNLGKENLSINGLKLSLGAYETQTVSVDGDLKKSAAQELQQIKDRGYISYFTTEDTSIPDEFEDTQLSMLHSVLKAQLIDAPNVGTGGTTVTVGFRLVNINDIPVKMQTTLEFAVFQDQWGTTPASVAILDTATNGTILAGAATAALKVLTDVSGEFTCTLTDTIDETVWLGCSQSFMSPVIICLSKDSVTFSA